MTVPDCSTASDLGSIKQDLINSFDCSLDRVVAVPVRTSRLTPNHVIPGPARMEHNKVNVTVDPNVSHKPFIPQICRAMSSLRRGECIELDQGPPARCGSLAMPSVGIAFARPAGSRRWSKIASAAVRQKEPIKLTEVRLAGDRAKSSRPVSTWPQSSCPGERPGTDSEQGNQPRYVEYSLALLTTAE